MGLERAAACLQGVSTVFETDVFRPIVAAVAETLGVQYDRDQPDGVRIRRMADHSRALAFCIHENVRPGPEKQGYVIRRLLRRAVLDAYQMGRREPFLHQIVPVVAEAMSRAYPELERERPPHPDDHQAGGGAVPPQPGERPEAARATSSRRPTAAGSDTISGRDAFDLHATYGIPIEVVESLATDRNLRVDRAGFEAEIKKHAAISRGTTEAADVFAAGPLDALKQEYHPGSEFVGYATTREEARVIGILEQNRLAESAEANGGASLALVLDRTPFYGESGGQVGDTGTIRGDRFTFQVLDTKKENDFVLHIGQVAEGRVTVQREGAGRGRRRASRRDPPRPHARPTCCTTPCGRSSASTPSRPAARSSPTGCGSTSAIPRRSAATGSAPSRTRSTSGSSRPPR